MNRILLIDDDEEDQLLFRDLVGEIRGGKCEITWTPSFEEGLAQLKNASYDVCFLDYRLDARTGIDLLK
ncbi:MAG: response regulator, partial [Verrucomicrobiaceae bacterium]